MENVEFLEQGHGPDAIVAVIVIVVVIGIILAMAPNIRNRPHGDQCEDCHLPRITTKMWDREEYRCRECGTRYRIVTDIWRPREEYRRWVATNRGEELDDAPGRR